MSDIASRLGMDVPKLTAGRRSASGIIPYAGTRNPVDITGQTLNTSLVNYLDILIEEDVCDIIVIYMAMATQSPTLGNLQEIFQYSTKHPEVPIVVSVHAEGERRRELEELGYIVRRSRHARSALPSLLTLGSFAADMPPAPIPEPGCRSGETRTKSRRRNCWRRRVFRSWTKHS